MDVKSIKQGLATIIRPEYRAILITIISKLSIEATKIACLASLLFLMKVIYNLTFVLCCFLDRICFRRVNFFFVFYRCV